MVNEYIEKAVGAGRVSPGPEPPVILTVPQYSMSLTVNGCPVAVDSRPATGFSLGIVRPNPSPGSVVIEYSVPAAAASAVRLEIYGAQGRLVRTLVDGPRPPGWQQVQWDGRGDDGRRLAAGVYFCRMRAEGVEHSRTVVLVP